MLDWLKIIIEDAALQDVLSQLQRAKKQHAVIMQLFTMDYKQGVKVSTLPTKAQVSSGVIKSLIDKGILDLFEQAEDRVTGVAAAADYNIQLSCHKPLLKLLLVKLKPRKPYYSMALRLPVRPKFILNS